jgi:biotin carboxylase
LLGWKEPVVRSLLARGVQVTCVDGRDVGGDAGGLRVVRVHDPADVSDVLAGLVRADVPLTGFTHVLSAKEFPIVGAAALAAALGAKGMDPVVAVSLRDKYAQKNRVRAAGVPVADASLLHTFDELKNADLPRPFVLKPPAGGGARGTFVIDDRTDLDTAELRDAFAGSAPLLAESFVRGHEIHVDGVVRRGRVLAHTVSRYLENLITVRDGGSVGSVLLPPAEHAGLYAEAGELVDRVLAALGHRDGVFHLEAFVTDAGLVFSECGGRVGGVGVHPTVLAATSIDLHEQWVDAALGVERDHLPVAGDGWVYGWLRLAAAPGELTVVPSAAEVRDQPGVVWAHTTAVPGDVVGDPTSSTAVGLGSVVARAESVDLLAQRMGEIDSWFRTRCVTR